MAKSLINVLARSSTHKFLHVSNAFFGCDNASTVAASRSLSTGATAFALAKLTPAEVSARLRAGEFTTGEEDHVFRSGPVKSVDFNKLRSNNPIEDAHAEGVADLGEGGRKAMLFAIIDGHGGASCGQVWAYHVYV
jgi:hypothetical protein